MKDKLKIMFLWQTYLWVIGSMFTLGVHWVMLSIIGITWTVGDAIIASLTWPLTLGIDLMRLWEMFA